MPSDRLALPRAAETPEQALEEFLTLLNGADLELLTGLLRRDACFVTADGTAIHGRSETAKALRQLVAMRFRVEVEQRRVIVVSNVAVAKERWRTEVSGNDGGVLRQSTRATIVLTQVEDEWKLALAAPWGWG